ncbi:MAG: AAA family ATPase [Candidatus Woesearchaeota archaeon]|nr:AAA family ATPase [Candidatus Woesearchaeota archaeon]
MIITISGDPGSGKSTLGRMLAAEFGIPFFSMGDVRREFAADQGMTITELNERAKTDATSDELVDNFQSTLPEKHESFVIDSRLGFHFIPQSVKIFVHCEPNEAARRILEQNREGESFSTVEEGAQSIVERRAMDTERYLQLYHIDPTDEAHYDFVIDSTNITPMEKMDKVLAFLKDNTP